MKEFSEEIFNRILKKHIDLKPCTRCGYPSGEIVVRLPMYGRYGAVVRCGHCGAETKIHGVSYTMFCGKRIGSPTIKSSLMGGIERAIQDWNGGAYNGRKETD